jgi:protein-export membrane protein SecD
LNDLRWRSLVIVGTIALSIFALYPTLRYARLSENERREMGPQAESLKTQSLRLGLDLQGGMHIVLEIDDSGLDGAEVRTGDLMDRALEVIRNRIDEFGVTEPIVQRAGSKRIIVELAGIDDPERAEQIISKAAILEFQMVRSGREMRGLVDKLDLHLAALAGGAPDEGAPADTAAGAAPADTAAAASADTSTAPASAPEVAAGTLPRFLAEDVRTSGAKPLSSRILYFTQSGRVAPNEVAAVREDDVEIVSAHLKELAGTRAIPGDVEFAWAADAHTDGSGNRMRTLYLLTASPELTGEMLEDARPQPDTNSNVPGNFLVQFELSRQGGRLFSRTTGDNVGRLMAIVLDGKVKSAPEIQDKIRGGTATITGRFTAEEATDLAVVLRAGALPVPIRIEEKRAVGPSLGADSIAMGTKSVVYGFIGILAFMLIYYRVGGLIAIFALFLNIVFLAAIMVYLDAVLTLPGLAGFVLTVGMSVDANVLIFERMREELRLGQSFRNAVNRGYDKAFRTILDSNVTTLVSALALLWLGTGPIKGFAIVLAIGIVVSMYTGVFITRVIFDLLTSRGGVKAVSI